MVVIDRDVLGVLLAGSPFVQLVFEVAAGGELVGLVATQAARRCGLVLADDVVGRAIGDVLRPDFARSIREGLRDALRLGEPVSHEEFVSLGGREVWGITTLTPLFEAGVPAYLVASFLELDFVERTETELSQVKAAMRELVGASSDAIVLTQHGRITYANAAAEERLGASAAELAGRPLGDLISSDEARVVPLTSSTEPASLVLLRNKGR